MLQIIGSIIVIIIVCVFVKKLASISIKLAKAIFWVALGITAGPPVLVGYMLERTCAEQKIRTFVSITLVILTWLLFLAWGFFNLHPTMKAFSFDTLKFVLPAFLFNIMLPFHKAQKEIEARSVPLDLFRKKRDEFYVCFFSAFVLLAVSATIYKLFLLIGWSSPSAAWYAGLGYWLAAVLVQLYAIIKKSEIKSLSKEVFDELSSVEKLPVGDFIEGLKKKYSALNKDEVLALFDGIAAKLIQIGIIEEIELNESTWLFNKYFHENLQNALQDILGRTLRHTEQDLLDYIDRFIELPAEASKDYATRFMDFGNYYDFDDGCFFVSYANSSRINVCFSCGLAEITNEKSSASWYCSPRCIDTETICLTIKNIPPDKFVLEASTSGFVLMQGGLAWDQNTKVFATGGQGHGFAAENANNMIDRIKLKDSQVVGGDNAKNGADRIVDGQQIQTKYCGTAGESVNAGFDGQGAYKYLDSNGKPMQLEVPKDQYDAAVKKMAQKIEQGKVPGVSDPNEAKNLIRKGNISYQQARNITKFGTFESITYDIAEGAIVSTAAGGISFGINAAIYYLNTKDSKEALKVGALQAGKTFGKSLVVYVTTQQLHRLAAIQTVLKHVEVGKLSNGLSTFLKDGFGVNSIKSVNKALRGTIVSSAAIIACSTGPDLIKLARGRISNAQFVKNLAVASSGVGGGAIGAIAGGFLCAELGPVGIFFGQAVGGMIGGSLAAFLSSEVSKVFMKEDRQLMMELIVSQLEFLVVSFMLTIEEIENLNTNLCKVINQETLEIIFAAKGQRRAMANFILKPVVISVIKQRPVLYYTADDVIDACSDWAA